jgi:3-oxoacyl-[acyl-carrier protein] reductase
MAGRLEGRVALVTGAGRGIGREIARKLGGEGARLVLNDLDAEPNQAVVEELRGEGIEAVACPGSVAAPDFGERLVQSAVSAFGGVDIIVNNAGYTWDSVIQKMTDEQWYAIIDVHLTGPMRILRAAQPVIRDLAKADRVVGRRNVRKVVNISSIAGIFGNVGQSNYASAKAGIIALTQTLAKEWGRIDTTVNCVAFGLIRTRLTSAEAGTGATANIEGRDIKIGINSDLLASMERTIPLGRAGTPEDAAGAVYLFCIPESDYVSGQTLMCSGGLTGF